jgi:hypothetical protein
MLGIEDKWVSAAYVLTLCSSILCVVYGVAMRQRSDDAVTPTDVKWAAEEDKVKKEM